MTVVLTCYLVAINVATFAVFCIDKRRAFAGAWRIPERVLLGLSAAGGAAGGIVGMRMAHHKTRKWYFALGLPVMLAAQLAGAICLCRVLCP